MPAPKRTRRLFKRVLVIGLCIALGLAALTYWRPIAVITVVQGALLRLGGIQSKYAQVGAYRVHYLVGGSGSPLLLLHGHPSRALEWSPLLPKLTRGHRVVAIDFLGYGESDTPDIDYSIASQTTVVNGLLDQLGLAQTDVLGFSMGGWVALRLAADHPDRVRRLVLVDSGGLTFPVPVAPESYVPRTIAEFRALESIQSDRRIPTFLARDMVRLSQQKAWVLRRVGTTLFSFREALDGRLTNLRMPVLILWGKADRLIPYQVALRLERELSQAQVRLVGLEGCGHVVLWDCTDRALPEVLAFLQ